MTEQGIQLSVLYSAISILSTALVFLYSRITRSESRLQRALKDEADKCESEKARMYAFIMELMHHMTTINNLRCPALDCPLRALLPPMPQPRAEDVGLRVAKK